MTSEIKTSGGVICRNVEGDIRLCCEPCVSYGPITLVSIPCYGNITWDLTPYQLYGLLGGCRSTRRWRIINISTGIVLRTGMIDCDGTLIGLPASLSASCVEWYSSRYSSWSVPINQRLSLQHFCL